MTYQQPSFDDIAPGAIDPPDAALVPLPIGITRGYQLALERTDGGQCENRRSRAGATRPQCDRTQRGGHKLYLWADGRLYCKDHFDDRRLGRLK